MSAPGVLIIDDDAGVQRALTSALSVQYCVHLASTGEEGLKRCEQVRPDLVLLDLMLPQMSGMAVLRQLKKISSQLPVIMMTAYAQVHTAVEAIKLGAADYLAKPFDPHHLLREVELIVAARSRSPQSLGERIIGESPAIERVRRLVERFGPTDMPILLQGETGTGKGLFAQALHEFSRRSQGPLVAIDCGTLPEQLAESELFGYEDGAFTGAGKKKPGRVAFADHGTLFLDEIAVLGTTSQAKLLSLIEQQGFVPLGARDARPKRLDVRFISATNVPLRRAISDGTFREDLYHRLNGLTIELPPLRDRGNDVELLARHFLAEYGRQHAQPGMEISSECLEVFRQYAWPGNVRELQRVMGAAAVMADGVITPEHLPEHVRSADMGSSPQPPASLDLRELKEWAGREAQKRVILELHQRANMTQQEMAKLLGVDPKTLRSRLKDLASRSRK